MKRLLFLVCIGTLLIDTAAADDLGPFTTAGCSSFPDGTFDQRSLWAVCCIRHDFAYWKGGTYEERQAADEALAACVAEVGEAGVAKLMLAGVRVGGTPYLPTSYRWGYGWPFLRGYKSLTEKEQREVDKQLEALQIMIQTISEQLNAKDKQD